MWRISQAPTLAIIIILTQSNHPLPLQQQKSKQHPHQRNAFTLTQISEFFSLPPLALFRSLIQVAFISQTAPLSSAAAALGTDSPCVLSPEEPQLLSYPCSGQAPLLRLFLPPGLSLQSWWTPIRGESYFPIAGGNTHTPVLYVAFKIKHTSRAFTDEHQLILNLMHLITLKFSLHCSWLVKRN